MPMLRGVANRWIPQIQEFVVDLAPGRDLLLPPLRPCGWCQGQRRIYEPGPLGYMAVLCANCNGEGLEPAR